MKARTRGAVAPTKIGYALSGLLGAGIIVIGARFLVAPPAAAAAYGITNEQGGPAGDPSIRGPALRSYEGRRRRHQRSEAALGFAKSRGAFFLAVSTVRAGSTINAKKTTWGRRVSRPARPCTGRASRVGE